MKRFKILLRVFLDVPVGILVIIRAIFHSFGILCDIVAHGCNCCIKKLQQYREKLKNREAIGTITKIDK